MLCDDLEGYDGGGMGERLKREGIYMYIYMHTHVHTVDSLCCTAETQKHNFVKQLYSNKIVKKKRTMYSLEWVEAGNQ